LWERWEGQQVFGVVLASKVFLINVDPRKGVVRTPQGKPSGVGRLILSSRPRGGGDTEKGVFSNRKRELGKKRKQQGKRRKHVAEGANYGGENSFDAARVWEGGEQGKGKENRSSAGEDVSSKKVELRREPRVLGTGGRGKRIPVSKK